MQQVVRQQRTAHQQKEDQIRHDAIILADTAPVYLRYISISMRTLILVLAAALTLFGQQRAEFNDGDAHGDPPFLVEDGWTPLLNGRDLSGWRRHLPPLDRQQGRRRQRSKPQRQPPPRRVAVVPYLVPGGALRQRRQENRECQIPPRALQWPRHPEHGRM